MWLRANIANVFIVISSIAFVFFFPKVKSVHFVYIFLLIYLDFFIYKTTFEYQRITYILARIAKHNGSSVSIPQLQLLMTTGSMGIIIFLQAFLTGFIIAYLYLNSIVYLLVFLVVRYLLNFIVPTITPYRLLFTLLTKEFKKIASDNPVETIEKIRLAKYFEEMPHTKEYENWAFLKFGNDLLKYK